MGAFFAPLLVISRAQLYFLAAVLPFALVYFWRCNTHMHTMWSTHQSAHWHMRRNAHTVTEMASTLWHETEWNNAAITITVIWSQTAGGEMEAELGEIERRVWKRCSKKRNITITQAWTHSLASEALYQSDVDLNNLKDPMASKEKGDLKEERTQTFVSYMGPLKAAARLALQNRNRLAETTNANIKSEKATAEVISTKRALLDSYQRASSVGQIGRTRRKTCITQTLKSAALLVFCLQAKHPKATSSLFVGERSVCAELRRPAIHVCSLQY